MPKLLVKGLTAARGLRVVHSRSERKLGLQAGQSPAWPFIKSSSKYLFFWLVFNDLPNMPNYQAMT
jgi:hypothetical protein